MEAITEEKAVNSVGEGWEKLIRDLYAIMPAGVRVVQVKEKFGGLRFYYEGGDEAFRDEVEKAESASYRMCERCGAPGSSDSGPNGQWILTLCDQHKAERKERRAGNGLFAQERTT